MKEIFYIFCLHGLTLLLFVNLTASSYKSSNEDILRTIGETTGHDHQVNATANNVTFAPLIFPKNDSKHHFIDNTTIMENLALHDSLLSNKTEAEDLRQGGEYSRVDTSGTISGQNSIPLPSSFASSSKNTLMDPNSQTELIEENGANTEDERLIANYKTRGKFMVESDSKGNSHEPETTMVQGQLAAILAGVFVILSVIGYVALLSWRRFLENRYGNREMLVNEDDFNDPRDLGHFSL